MDHLSFRVDLGVILATIKTVLKREGISEAGGVTMTEFTGNHKQ